MKTSSLNEIKKELNYLAPNKVLELCLRLARYKKDNKELLHYLLFESHNEQGYIDTVKEEIDDQFLLLSKGNLYIVNKGLRKIVKGMNKHIRYSGNKQTEAELRIHFCKKLKASGIAIHRSTSLTNLYEAQLKNIRKALEKLHEDLQYDYNTELQNL